MGKTKNSTKMKAIENDEKDSDQEYEVEYVVDHQVGHYKNESPSQLAFKVHWKGYACSEDSWLRESDCSGIKELIKMYFKQVGGRATALAKGGQKNRAVPPKHKSTSPSPKEREPNASVATGNGRPRPSNPGSPRTKEYPSKDHTNEHTGDILYQQLEQFDVDEMGWPLIPEDILNNVDPNLFSPSDRIPIAVDEHELVDDDDDDPLKLSKGQGEGFTTQVSSKSKGKRKADDIAESSPAKKAAKVRRQFTAADPDSSSDIEATQAPSSKTKGRMKSSSLWKQHVPNSTTGGRPVGALKIAGGGNVTSFSGEAASGDEYKEEAEEYGHDSSDENDEEGMTTGMGAQRAKGKRKIKKPTNYEKVQAEVMAADTSKPKKVTGLRKSQPAKAQKVGKEGALEAAHSQLDAWRDIYSQKYNNEWNLVEQWEDAQVGGGSEMALLKEVDGVGRGLAGGWEVFCSMLDTSLVRLPVVDATNRFPHTLVSFLLDNPLGELPLYTSKSKMSKLDLNSNSRISGYSNRLGGGEYTLASSSHHNAGPSSAASSSDNYNGKGLAQSRTKIMKVKGEPTPARTSLPKQASSSTINVALKSTPRSLVKAPNNSLAGDVISSNTEEDEKRKMAAAAAEKRMSTFQGRGVQQGTPTRGKLASSLAKYQSEGSNSVTLAKDDGMDKLASTSDWN